MRFGYLVAMESEYLPFLHKLGSEVGSEVVSGIDFVTFSSDCGEVVLAKSGIGEIAAASATALLIGHFGCGFIVNFGLVGALSPLAVGSIVVVNDVVLYDCDLTPFGSPLGQPAGLDRVAFPLRGVDGFNCGLSNGFPSVRLASGDKFVADSKLKEWIRSEFSADICDMEGAGVAIAAYRAGVPCTMIKLVSDGADEGAVEAYRSSKERAFDLAVDFVLSVLRRGAL